VLSPARWNGGGKRSVTALMPALVTRRRSAMVALSSSASCNIRVPVGGAPPARQGTRTTARAFARLPACRAQYCEA